MACSRRKGASSAQLLKDAQKLQKDIDKASGSGFAIGLFGRKTKAAQEPQIRPRHKDSTEESKQEIEEEGKNDEDMNLQ